MIKKDLVIDWVCKSCLEFETAEVSAENREQALKELECHYCGEDENLIFQQDIQENGIDEENCWYCGKTKYYYTANGPEECSNCGKPPEQGEPDWEDRE